MENYNQILERMQNKFTELAGFSPNDASDVGIRMRVLAGEILSLNTNIEWIKNQMFANTALGEQLDLHAEERGIYRKLSAKSFGTLTFSRDDVLEYDVEIPKGTICSTADVDGVRFETTESVILVSGDLSVTVGAQSVVGGKNANVLKNKITVMVTPPSGITKVTNEVPFTGGLDGETDKELRARILDSYKNISNGTNIAFYKDEALKYDGVYSASVVPRARGNGTVDIYVAGKGTLLSDETLNTIQKGIEKSREINVDVEVKSPELMEIDTPIKVKIEDGYLFSEVKEECLKVIKDYFSSLAIGEDVIFAAMGNKIFNLEGVKNYSFGSTLDYDRTVPATKLAVLGAVAVDPL